MGQGDPQYAQWQQQQAYAQQQAQQQQYAPGPQSQAGPVLSAETIAQAVKLIDEEREKKKTVDKFELVTAILLGLGATMSACTAFQGSQWGGNSTADYGEAAAVNAKATTAFNFAMTVATNDLDIDLEAKMLLVEAMRTDDEKKRDTNIGIAKYLYTQRMSKKAYLDLGLPEDYYTKDTAKWTKLPDKALKTAMEHELDTKYVEAELAPATAAFKQGEDQLKKARSDGERSTKYGIVAVTYSVGLFLTGLALLFKSKIRWGFFAIGFVTFLVATLGFLGNYRGG
jgi:hypothetical protein